MVLPFRRELDRDILLRAYWRMQVAMYQAFEATIDQSGQLHRNETIQLPGSRRALVIVFNDAANLGADETALLSEESLAEVWNRPEEDAAWAYLQSEK